MGWPLPPRVTAFVALAALAACSNDSNDCPDCGGDALDPDSLGLESPHVTDVGWDGTSCPAGTTLVDGTDPETQLPGPAAWCSRAGVPDGPAWRRSHDTPAYPLEVGHFAAGQRDGLWLRLYPPVGDAQRLAEVGSYAAGARTGTWRFYRADGGLERSGPFVDDLEDGLWQGYAPGPTHAWSGSYDAGQRVGKWQTFYPDAQVANEENWRDGVRHGPFVHWFEGGTKAREGAYLDGAWSGVVTTYWESTEATRYATTYVGGIAHGPHRQWTEDGQLEAQGDYRAGVADGAWTQWLDPHPIIMFFGGPAAHTKVTVTWVDGRLEGPNVGYYDDDAVAWRATYASGVDEGPAEFYWPTGQVLAAGHYEGGAAQGPWQTYYASGAANATLPYARGRLHGDYHARYEDGRDRAQGRYVDDRRVGLWTTWGAAGVATTEDCGTSGEACDCAATETCR